MAHEFEPSGIVSKRKQRTTKSPKDEWDEVLEKYSEPLKRLQGPKASETEACKETNASFRPTKKSYSGPPEAVHKGRAACIFK